MIRGSAARVGFVAMLAAFGCSSDQKTHIDIELGDGGAAPFGGSSGSSALTSGGASGAGGATTMGNGGMSGGAGGAGGAPTSGSAGGGVAGAASTGGAGGVAGSAAAGAGGAGGAASRCNGCWLLADNVEWERFDAFLSDGTQLVWQDLDDNVVTMGFDGSNQKTLTMPACKYPWKGAFLFDGYVYFSELHASSSYGIFRVAAGVAQGATCEQKYTGADDALSTFLDVPRNTFWVGSGTAETNLVTRIVRVDYPSFATHTEIDNLNAYIEAADDGALYGYSNYHIVRYDRATKAMINLNDDGASSNVIAVDDTYVYYMSGANLKRTPKGSHTTAMPEVVPGPNQPWRIAADGNRVVYWTLGDTHFYSTPLAGGTPTDVSLGTFQIRGLTWDATRYFVMTGPLDGPYKLLRLMK